MLASHDSIETVSEPWLLLPLIYAIKKEGSFAEYSHNKAVLALMDFFIELPNGNEDYYEAVAALVRTLYQKASPSNASYFLDKTPRYALISDEIIQMFPDGKFIILWRNPLAVISSILNTWGRGRWNVYLFKVDLFKGQDTLIEVYQKYSDRILPIQYESFVSNPNAELERIGSYLDIQFDGSAIELFSSVILNGKMGDSVGVTQYKSITCQPLEKWKTTICNPWRVWWCRRYLKRLGVERLEVMGYSLQQLLDELDSVPFGLRFFFTDLFWATVGVVFCIFSPSILKAKCKKHLGWGMTVNHS